MLCEIRLLPSECFYASPGIDRSARRLPPMALRAKFASIHPAVYVISTARTFEASRLTRRRFDRLRHLKKCGQRKAPRDSSQDACSRKCARIAAVHLILWPKKRGNGGRASCSSETCSARRYKESACRSPYSSGRPRSRRPPAPPSTCCLSAPSATACRTMA
jgi:hypothetical protein